VTEEPISDPYASTEEQGEATPPVEVPPPLEAPPAVESLAEQVWRESHTVPESTGPSDVVPNRPNIRPPGVETVESVEDPGVESAEEEAVEEEAAGRASAADLIAEAQAAETTEELDDIEAQADGRVTVLNAVQARREELESA
jgi:hypothetical protein